jgi:4-methyl-5(b-hydroxyethyl)-thiazole monophosphate biosynthesis
MTTQRALIILHAGFEEMEAVAPFDLLARADVEVSLVSMTEEHLVRGRNNLVFQANHSFEQACAHELYDAVILPGGPGVNALRQHPELCEFLHRHHAAGKILACICAAPLLLLDAGLLPDCYTAHPSTLDELPHPEQSTCVWDGTLLTSQGAGTATEFGLALVQALTDQATRAEIEQAICWSSK